MQQTPIHHYFNPDLLALMPSGLARVVEAGCSSGALAEAYRRQNPSCVYTGIEIDASYAAVASKHCQHILTGNVEQMDDQVLATLAPADCWVFGDVLEHLYDPWRFLQRVALTLSPHGSVVACIPNAQHWSFQWRVNSGHLQYADSGLMDRTHIRWFSRQTIHELFAAAGMRIVVERPRIFNEPQRELGLNAVRAFALAANLNPEQAVREAMPLQWVVRAEPFAPV